MRSAILLICPAILSSTWAYRYAFDNTCNDDQEQQLDGYFEDAAVLAATAYAAWTPDPGDADPQVAQIFGSMTALEYCTVRFAYEAAQDIARDEEFDSNIVVKCPAEACITPDAIFNIDNLARDNITLNACPRFWELKRTTNKYRGRLDPSDEVWKQVACSGTPDALSFNFAGPSLFHETAHMRWIDSWTKANSQNAKPQGCGQKSSVRPVDNGYSVGYGGDEATDENLPPLTGLTETTFSTNNADTYMYFPLLLYRRQNCGWKSPSGLTPQKTTDDFPSSFLRCTVPCSSGAGVAGPCTECPPQTVPTIDTIQSIDKGSLIDVLYCRLPKESDGCGSKFDLKHMMVMFEEEARKRTVCVPKASDDVVGAAQDSDQQVVAELKI